MVWFNAPAGQVRHVEHGHRALILLAQEFEPFEKCEASCVGEQQQVGIGEFYAGGPHVARLQHADIAFHIGADILAVPVLLRFRNVVGGKLAHAGLQCVDLRQDREQIEGAQQFGQITGNKRGDDSPSLFTRPSQRSVVVPDELLLQDHALLFLHGRCLHSVDAHASLHSRMESEKVPACSRMTANCPVSSEYLNWVWGMCSRSRAATSMGCSSSAGSQKLGAQKMTPSARFCRTASTSHPPRCPSGA